MKDHYTLKLVDISCRNALFSSLAESKDFYMKWQMQRLEQLENVPAFNYLEEWQQQLVRLAFTLWQRERQAKSHFLDYSFVVFPMAKAYEGFLKRFLLDLGLISESTFASRRFRIGRVLNPDVRAEHQNEVWLYDDVVKMCGKEVAREIWESWLTCRNRVFHYFPKNTDRLTLEQAGRYVEQIFNVMQAAVSCQVRVEDTDSWRQRRDKTS